MASFASGLDVFKRLRQRRENGKKRRKLRDEPPGTGKDGEVRLSRSLRQGPEAIGREYQLMGTQAGPRFAVGDSTAQTSLAEILLRLNTGLVGIIASFLSRDKPHQLDLDYRSLTELSEHSRRETVGVLRQLYQRLLSRQAPARQLLATPDDRVANHQERSSDARHAMPKRTKVRGPMLARVVIQDSSKPSQIAIVRPGEGKKKSTSSSHSRSASASVPLRKLKAAGSSLSLPPSLLLPEPEFRETIRPMQRRSKTSPAVPSRDVRSDLGAARGPKDAKQPTQMHPEPYLPPLYELFYSPLDMPSKPKSPSPPAHLPYRHRKETPTFYSTATGSTKLGEIPMSKWPEPYDFEAMEARNREALANGWPLPVDAAEGRKKRGGFFGLFRKKQETVV